MATEKLPTPRLEINKFLLCTIGLWPYQSIGQKIFLYCLMLSLTISQSYFQIAGVINGIADVDIVLQCIPNVLTDFIVGAKIVNFFFNGNKMKNLLDILEEDWKHYQRDTELHEVLDKCGREARKLTLIYCGFFWGSMAPFMLIPLFPIVYNPFVSENSSLPRQLLFEQYIYFFNLDKYYYPVFLHTYLGTGAFIMAVISIDTMFIVFVQHAVTLFSIIGKNVENISRHVELDTGVYPTNADDITFRAAIACLSTHQHALSYRYASLIEDAHCVAYFFQLGISMICVSFTGFQIVMNLDTAPDVSARFFAFTITQMTFLFIISWPAQTLFDCSQEIPNFVNHSQWYKASIRTRKLLNLMILRSQKPCLLTAGKFYILNLASFGAVVKTSMSYVMVLQSMK